MAYRRVYSGAHGLALAPMSLEDIAADMRL